MHKRGPRKHADTSTLALRDWPSGVRGRVRRWRSIIRAGAGRWGRDYILSDVPQLDCSRPLQVRSAAGAVLVA